MELWNADVHIPISLIASLLELTTDVDYIFNSSERRNQRDADQFSGHSELHRIVVYITVYEPDLHLLFFESSGAAERGIFVCRTFKCYPWGEHPCAASVRPFWQ